MQDKQKVTLYLPPELHRQLKVRAAVDAEAMSSIVERAVVFYLNHPDVVDEMDTTYGRTHQIHTCPECATPVVLKDGEMVALGTQPTVLSDADEEISIQQNRKVGAVADQQGEEELVPC
jgi:hypothetical protein